MFVLPPINRRNRLRLLKQETIYLSVKKQKRREEKRREAKPIMASTNSRPSRSSIQSTRSAATTTAGRVKIKPPTTTNDTGDPTDCCLFDAKRVLRLIEDERYLSAQSLHQSIRDRIQKEIDDANAAAADNNNNDSTTSNSKKRDSYARKEQSSRKRQMLKHQKSSKKGFNEANVKALQLLDENEDILNNIKFD